MVVCRPVWRVSSRGRGVYGGFGDVPRAEAGPSAGVPQALAGPGAGFGGPQWETGQAADPFEAALPEVYPQRPGYPDTTLNTGQAEQATTTSYLQPAAEPAQPPSGQYDPWSAYAAPGGNDPWSGYAPSGGYGPSPAPPTRK